MAKNSGRKWPIIIFVSTLFIIGFSIATIRVAIKNPVELSDYGMQNYHTYDDNANDIINAKIAFDRYYTVAFLTSALSEKETIISYSIKDKEGKAVNDANVTVVLTRPDTTKLDICLDHPVISDGIYTFTAVNLPKLGRWDILAKITVGENQRYYNLKADTRYPNTTEF